MDIVKSFQNLISSIAEGVSRIFGASDDDYPKTGVQPFEGKANRRKHK